MLLELAARLAARGHGQHAGLDGSGSPLWGGQLWIGNGSTAGAGSLVGNVSLTAGHLLLNKPDDLTLAGVLHPRSRMLLDTGDRDGGEIHGRAGVIRGLRALGARHPDAAAEAVPVNGSTGLALRRGDGVVVAVVCVDLDAAGVVTTLWVTAAPSKLGHWNRPHDRDDRRDPTMPSRNRTPPGRSW